MRLIQATRLLQKDQFQGDTIRINIPENKLDFVISEEELKERRAKWQPRTPKITTGYLARYAAMVTSGNRGAILEIPKI